MRTRSAVTAAASLALLASCSSPAEPAATPAPTVTVTAPAPPAETVTVEAAPVTETVTVEAEPMADEGDVEATPASDTTGITFLELGETADMPTAAITVNSVEQVPEIVSEYGDVIRPGEGESLWLISMEWTNLDSQAVSKVCWGPYTVSMEVLDSEQRSLLQSDESGSIPGNDCSNGLLTGQSGEWYQAYIGLEGASVDLVGFYEWDPDDAFVFEVAGG